METKRYCCGDCQERQNSNLGTLKSDISFMPENPTRAFTRIVNYNSLLKVYFKAKNKRSSVNLGRFYLF